MPPEAETTGNKFGTTTVPTVYTFGPVYEMIGAAGLTVILTIVVPEGAGIGGTGYLQIVKVCNYQVTYSERRHSIYKSKI